MFGEVSRTWTVTIVENYRGFLLAILPPGAFIGMGFMIAFKNIVDARESKETPVQQGCGAET
jgi:electron transport complex protein RnfE